MIDRGEKIEELEKKIKTLIEKAWTHSGLNMCQVRSWRNQFKSNDLIEKDEQIQFLFLLSKFMYFGKNEIFNMLISIYRDLYKYKIIHKIRLANNDTLDEKFLNKEFEKVLARTRFMGVGNPSESGQSLLYKFRQINGLSKKQFINVEEIFKTTSGNKGFTFFKSRIPLKRPDIEYYIFIDDLTCTGDQALDYSKHLVTKIKQLKPTAKVFYFVLFATQSALEILRRKTKFDQIDAVFKLDSTFKCFEKESRYYKNENEIFDREFTRRRCEHYDFTLEDRKYKLGFDSSQLLLAFEHNTPDNTPPIFWSEGSKANVWTSLFKRFHKY